MVIAPIYSPVHLLGQEKIFQDVLPDSNQESVEKNSDYFSHSRKVQQQQQQQQQQKTEDGFEAK